MSETTNLKLFKHDNPSTNENQFDVETALNDNWDKIDEFAGDVKEQIIAIEDEIDGQAEDIEITKQEFENEVQELEQDIQSNSIIEETEQAKQLYIDDASGARGSLAVEGNAEQEVQEGTSNLAVLEDGTYTQNGVTVKVVNGEVTLSGTSTAGVSLILGTAYLYAGKTYYSKREGGNSGFRLQDSTGQQYWFVENTESSFVCAKTGEHSIIMSANSNQTPSGTVKLRVSETSGAEWEEGKKPIPSPQYKSEINVLEAGSTEIKKTGKNIMSIYNLGTDWEYTEKGIKNLKNNSGANITVMKLKKGQTVKIALKLFSKPEKSTSFTSYVDNIEGDTTYNFANINQFNLNQVYERTYTATKDCTLRYTLWRNADSSIFEFQMWAELNTLTDYEQYKEEVYDLNIQQDMLSGDCFIKEEDSWKEVHLRAKRNIKDDIANATLSSVSAYIFVSGLLKNIAKSVRNTEDANIISNVLKHATYDDMLNSRVDSGIGISDLGSLIIRIKDCSTLQEYKDVLNDDSFYYYYYLATPTKLQCTEAQIEVLEKLSKLRFYKGVNNIFTTEDIALLQAKYSVDIQTKLNNINAQLLNLGGN